jgi:hypothetical protein
MMELRQCSCGYTGQDTEFAEHLGEVFIPAGARHPGAPRMLGLTCLCGFLAGEPAVLDDHLLAMFITPDQVGTDGARHAEEGITEPLLLCPGCCVIDDIPEWVPTAKVLTPLVACNRCPFTFPILPGDFRQLTLDAMHNHQCIGMYQGNWPELGQAIVGAIHDKGISADEFAARLEGTWPGGKIYSRQS